MNARTLQPGQVDIRGKIYETVALRVQKFRDAHKDFTLETEIVCREIEVVVLKATIRDPSGRVLATGHAEEFRTGSGINSTSALENAETSAIGRALAAFGLGGTEFASADEVSRAVSGAKPAAPQASAQGVKDSALAALPTARRNIVVDTATQTKDALREGRDIDALGLAESLTDQEETVALWGLLASNERTRIKAASAAAAKLAENKAAAAEWKREVTA